MAVYKIPQDVEAEDKLVGPFTFRQFIFLIIAAISGYLVFAFAQINIFLVIIPLPFFLVFAFVGLYRRQDQPVEIYLAALLRFYFKPRRRIWDQDGITETVQITAPKIDRHQYTNNLSEGEVQSRLNNLASIMDTRGWSSKNVALQANPTPAIEASDRLVLPAQENEPVEVHQYEDMLDTNNNAVARHFDEMVQQSASIARQQAVQHMQKAAPAPTIVEPTATQPAPQPVAPTGQAQHVLNYDPYGHIHQRVINPLDERSPSPQQNTPVPQDAVTGQSSPDILGLARNSDLNVDVIARQASEPEHDFRNDETVRLH